MKKNNIGVDDFINKIKSISDQVSELVHLMEECYIYEETSKNVSINYKLLEKARVELQTGFMNLTESVKPPKNNTSSIITDNIDKSIFDIDRSLVISTGHISEEDNGILIRHCKGEEPEDIVPDLVADSHSYGFSVYVGEGSIEAVNYNEMLSDGFVKSLQLGKHLGVNYVNFDADGKIYPFLPEYNW